MTDLNNYSIHLDWHLFLDHAPLTISISIVKENIVSSKFSIAKNSEEEANFIKDVSYAIKSINIANLSNTNKLEEVTNTFASKIDYTWRTNSKQVNIMRHSKSWWNKKYSLALNNYRTIRSLENWKIFKIKVKSIKWSFFNVKIQEIANKKKEPWKLMNWINKHKLSTIKTIKYNDQQCLDINNLWNALHSTFNMALHQQVDINILDEITNKPTSPWPAFSKEEFRFALSSCNNFSALGPDKLT